MKQFTILEILKNYCSTRTRDIITHILQLQGVIPFWFSGISSYGDKIEDSDRAWRIFHESLNKYKDSTDDYATIRRELDRQYLPDLQQDYLSHVLGITINGRTSIGRHGKAEYVYDNAGGIGRFFVCGERGKGDTSIYWLSKQTGRKLYDILDDYYRWMYAVRTLDSIGNTYMRDMYCIVADDEPLDVAEQPLSVPMTATQTIDPATWQPAALDCGSSARPYYVKDILRDKQGRYITGYSKRPLQYRPSPAHCRNIDTCMEWLEGRGMHKAINRPRKGWRVDYKSCSVVYEGVYTLAGAAKRDNVRNCMPAKVAELRRYMSPQTARDVSTGNVETFTKKFAKGSQSIPYLLENLSLRDKVLVVCEGVPDACFVRNGVAINCWKPSHDVAQPIIDYFQQAKNMRVIYITDNYAAGDKGGQRMLDWCQTYAPDAELLDWHSLCTTAKDVGEYVMERVQAGDAAFCTADGEYEMPRDVILAHVKRARDIVAPYDYTLTSLAAL